MSTNEFSDAALAEADVAIKTSQAYQPSKSEKRLNAVGNAIVGASNTYSSISQTEISTEAYTYVKDQISNFAKTSKILMSVLDEVAKAHPFIQVAVSLFKAGLTLELTRRENDGKVLALNLTMCDMMESLTLLKELANPKEAASDGRTIEDRLRQHLGAIVDSIKRCAKVCDSYQKRATVVKFFTSPKWQSKFTATAQEFVDHKAKIQFDLQMHASLGITTANVTLMAVSTNVSVLSDNVTKLMEVVFERMRTPEERDLSAYVSAQSGGAEAVLKDDTLLEKLLAESKQKTKDDKDKDKDKDRAAKKSTGSGQVPGETTLTVPDLRKELGKDVEQIIADNKYFDQKFEAMRIQVDEVKVTITHESDRVIDAVLAGPHERIVDRDMYHVWKEMGWKGSVKAKHLVMALRDHFAENSHSALAVIREITKNQDSSDSASVANAMGEIAAIANRDDPRISEEDHWALQYISVLRVQPLIEALDDDVSSFVTVAEVNNFTAARPQDWSLPKWIAYWTYGSEMAVQWYYRRIRKVICEMLAAALIVLPANRTIVADFGTSYQIRITEDILSGLRSVDEWDGFDWDDDVTFLRFKNFILENEARMEKKLRAVKYYFDAANTLAIVAGEGRPEKYMMPMIFLLLRRALYVVRQAKTVTLDPVELNVVSYSLYILQNVVIDRIHTLQAVYKLQNLDEKEQLNKFNFGLYSYAQQDPVMNDNWSRSLLTDARAVSDVTVYPNDASDAKEDKDTESDLGDIPLFYGPQTEDLDLVADPPVEAAAEESPIAASTVRSLVGHWSGSYTYDTGRDGDGFVSFTITSHDESDGSFSGTGMDAFGPFFVSGKVSTTDSTNLLNFMKEYGELQYGTKVVWRYEGVVSDDGDDIKGEWGEPEADWHFRLVTETEKGQEQPASSPDTLPSDQPDPDKSGADTESSITVPEIHVETVEDPADPDHVDGVGDDAGEDGQSETDDDDASEAGSLATALTTLTVAFSHGTFFLKRRPIEYLLACPPESEFVENRARALWKLAIKTTTLSLQRRRMTWAVLSERRKQRERYIELVKVREKEGSRSSFKAHTQEWAELTRGIHPEDLHLWRHIANFQMRRDIIFSSISCDGCGEWPLTPSRFICIPCSMNEVDHSIDLCGSCFHDRKSLTRGTTSHSPVHNIMQFRNVKWRILQRTLLDWGQEKVDEAEKRLEAIASGAASLSCVECKTAITARPFWACIGCEELTVVCYDCNARVTQKRPWLFQRRAVQDSHNWQHSLVSVPEASPPVQQAGAPLGVYEARMARVESRLDQQAVEMLARLASLEELVKQLLTSRDGNSHHSDSPSTPDKMVDGVREDSSVALGTN